MFEKCLKLDGNNERKGDSYCDALFRFGLYQQAIDRLLRSQQLQYKNNGQWEFILSYIYYHIIAPLLKRFFSFFEVFEACECIMRINRP